VTRLDTASVQGRDWRAWLRGTGKTPVSDPLLAFAVVDGRPMGEWPTVSGPRIYLALDEGGRYLYVGQTCRPLWERVVEHARHRNSTDWAWVISAAFDELSKRELDTLERSAARWFLPFDALVGRRYPRNG
jgi:hypothetical protein